MTLSSRMKTTSVPLFFFLSYLNLPGIKPRSKQLKGNHVKQGILSSLSGFSNVQGKQMLNRDVKRNLKYSKQSPLLQT